MKAAARCFLWAFILGKPGARLLFILVALTSASCQKANAGPPGNHHDEAGQSWWSFLPAGSRWAAAGASPTRRPSTGFGDSFLMDTCEVTQTSTQRWRW